ncbi:glycogen synthase [Haemophilus influenzae]|uniref:Glycogen synthase n=1 Tax=Haemophilus influenzae TaxID=727 RepID=A0A2X1PI56_HAEIF|nr:glycogen synthase [Haemophilus influenzae]
MHPHLEQGIRELAERYPQNIAVKIGYDEALSHLMVAGGDVILVPSRFEPCGLTQLYGLQYGTLPLVRKTGGLADTVVDSTSESIKARTATGFVFEQAEADDLRRTIQHAFSIWKKPRAWSMIRHGRKWNKTSAGVRLQSNIEHFMNACSFIRKLS